MKKLLLILFVLPLFYAMIINPGNSTLKYDLKYKYKKGTEFIISSTSSYYSTQEQQGDIAEVYKNGNFKYLIKVKEEKDNGFEIEMEYLEMKMEAERSSGLFNRDYSGFKGKNVSFLLSPSGETSGFEGFENLPEIAIENRTTFNKSQHIQEIWDIFPYLPDKEKEIGDSWTWTYKKERTNQGGKKSTVIREYTFRLIDEFKKNGFDCIKIESDYTEKETGEDLRMGSIDLKFNFEGKGKETFYFAYKEGSFIEVEGSFNRSGNVVAESYGMTIPVTEDIKYKRTIKFK